MEAARALASELGFTTFSPKRTQRFLDKRTGEVKLATGVKDSSGAVVRQLEPPSSERWLNREVETTWRQLLLRYGSQDAVHSAAEVKCKVGANGDRSVYVAADGLAFPCCWLGQQVYNERMSDDQRQVVRLAEALPGGLDALDARKHPLTTIVEGPLFRTVVASWEQPSVAAGKLKPCAAVCGSHCGAYDAQRTESTKLSKPAVAQPTAVAKPQPAAVSASRKAALDAQVRAEESAERRLRAVAACLFVALVLVQLAELCGLVR